MKRSLTAALFFAGFAAFAGTTVGGTGNGQIGTFGMKCDSSESASACRNVNALIEVLQSSKTPQKAKDLLIAAIDGRTKTASTVILLNNVVDAAGPIAFRSIKVGVDDLTDNDDNGYTFTYEITVKYVNEKIDTVTVELELS